MHGAAARGAALPTSLLAWPAPPRGLAARARPAAPPDGAAPLRPTYAIPGRAPQTFATCRIERRARARPTARVTLDQLGAAAEEQLACYNAALALDPQHARAHYNRGVTLRDLGAVYAASRSFRAAMSLEASLA